MKRIPWMLAVGCIAWGFNAAWALDPGLSQYLQKTGGKFILRVPPDTVWFSFIDPGLGGLRLSMFDVSISDGKKLDVFDHVWKTINREYYDPLLNGADWTAVRERYLARVLAAGDKVDLARVLDQMIHEIHGSHLQMKVYLLPKDKTTERVIERKWYEEREHYRVGVGFDLKRIQNQWVVGSVDRSSDAAHKGVQRGWVVLYLQDRFYDPEQVRLEAIKPGDVFPFSFMDLEGKQRNLTIACTFYPEPVELPPRNVRMLGGGLVCITLREFRRKMDSWLTGILRANARAPGMILDLRENTGGYMPIVTRCLSPFFDSTTVVGVELSRTRKPRILKSGRKNGRIYSGPLVVLLDEQSISGAEIFAAALQEKGRAKIVGRRSAGEVLGSVTREMPEWYTLRLPVYDYRTAEGRILEGAGVRPDEEVVLTLDDFRKNRDTDMEHALALIKAAEDDNSDRNSKLKKKD